MAETEYLPYGGYFSYAHNHSLGATAGADPPRAAHRLTPVAPLPRPVVS